MPFIKAHDVYRAPTDCSELALRVLYMLCMLSHCRSLILHRAAPAMAVTGGPAALGRVPLYSRLPCIEEHLPESTARRLTSSAFYRFSPCHAFAGTGDRLSLAKVLRPAVLPLRQLVRSRKQSTAFSLGSNRGKACKPARAVAEVAAPPQLNDPPSAAAAVSEHLTQERAAWKASIDFKYIRDNQEAVKQNCIDRNANADVDRVVELYEAFMQRNSVRYCACLVTCLLQSRRLNTLSQCEFLGLMLASDTQRLP